MFFSRLPMLQKQKQNLTFCLPLEKFRSGCQCRIQTTLHWGLLLPREGRRGRRQEKAENERSSCSKDSAKMTKFPHGGCAKFACEFKVSPRTSIAQRPAMDTNKRTAVNRYSPGSRHPILAMPAWQDGGHGRGVSDNEIFLVYICICFLAL